MLAKFKNSKGFTLIEMMIVVAIIGILAAVAIPRFIRFAVKARQTEAKINLAGLYEAQQSYYTDVNVYGTPGQAGWTPSSPLKYYTTTAANSTTTFMMTANGNIDTETATTDYWSVDQLKKEPSCNTNDVTS